jgi:hypothetical protein
MKLKKQLKKHLKTWSNLTCQTCNPGHKIEIIPWKTNKKKLWITILNQLNIKGQD